MKKNLLYLGFAGLLLVSCSGDDDAPFQPNELLKKWYVVSDVVGGVTMPYEHVECGYGYEEFLPNGILNSVSVDDCNSDSDAGTWVLNGKKLTITYAATEDEEADVVVADVKRLDAQNLQIQLSYDYDEDGDLDVVVTNFTSVAQ